MNSKYWGMLAILLAKTLQGLAALTRRVLTRTADPPGVLAGGCS